MLKWLLALALLDSPTFWRSLLLLPMGFLLLQQRPLVKFWCSFALPCPSEIGNHNYLTSPSLDLEITKYSRVIIDFQCQRWPADCQWQKSHKDKARKQNIPIVARSIAKRVSGSCYPLFVLLVGSGLVANRTQRPIRNQSFNISQSKRSSHQLLDSNCWFAEFFLNVISILEL